LRCRGRKRRKPAERGKSVDRKGGETGSTKSGDGQGFERKKSDVVWGT